MLASLIPRVFAHLCAGTRGFGVRSYVCVCSRVMCDRCAHARVRTSRVLGATPSLVLLPACAHTHTPDTSTPFDEESQAAEARVDLDERSQHLARHLRAVLVASVCTGHINVHP